MTQRIPTPIFRFLHLNNLGNYLNWESLYAPNYTPQDGSKYTAIYEEDIHKKRANKSIPCGRKGVIHDYVPFYLGERTPMLLKISNIVTQSDIIYLYSYVQDVEAANQAYVFSDGQGIMQLTKWYDSLNDLNKLDWDAIYANYWADTPEDPDRKRRKRRKQSEFLVHRSLPWELVRGVAVMNKRAKEAVESIFEKFDPKLTRKVIERPTWYY
jgi:hypothetical protein